ncbi:prolipoprotein diacylglyceryl transferase [Desulforamulus aquiferis]|uniref:Phosphatidylglycerol--prolipoprotein diacylglyceryl transferase n=1 Tax=Desulforamulus aquiferis TaxID=1397668 RepID=A0AAW7ZD96_9FIRM|nr:prolipoprotein diacylglyceryl transferase [Desulforamulus aquiferis]MDO7787366.1 prolipoprotein diacylglyceryl transferase [Desulforamulus aquiferis]
MYPILFYIGDIPVRAWGIMVALGVMAGLWLAIRLAKKENIDPERVVDFTIYAFFGGILGARLWEVIFGWEKFSSHPLDALKFWDGGLSIQGGVLAGLIICIWFVRKHKLPSWKFADILAPGLILGQGIGRIGCLLNGDAYGIPTSLPIGVIYKEGTPAYSAYGAQPLFPAEIIEGVVDIGILFILLRLIRGKPFDGSVALTYFLLYSLNRFIIEFWRADSLIVLGGLKAAQMTTLGTTLFALGLLTYKWYKTNKRNLISFD